MCFCRTGPVNAYPTFHCDSLSMSSPSDSTTVFSDAPASRVPTSASPAYQPYSGVSSTTEMDEAGADPDADGDR